MAGGVAGRRGLGVVTDGGRGEEAVPDMARGVKVRGESMGARTDLIECNPLASSEVAPSPPLFSSKLVRFPLFAVSPGSCVLLIHARVDLRSGPQD